jgi:cysteinyl-tRNA synthetase
MIVNKRINPMLKIYNSLTQQKETFTPIHPGKVNIYVCGPTVYDYAHIGNARTYAAFDVIIRYLRWRDYDVTYVRNITDIDDKIIKRAQENNVSFRDVVERYTQAIHEDFAALGLLAPNHEPTATGYIPQMIELISDLISKNNAYVAGNGDVNFSVRSFAEYGKLAHRDIEKLESGARVEIDNSKRDPLDFVLWKMAKPEEPSWESPWGAGRPGWHIECSAMSINLLGKHFDIHGGGKDLIFPHHENEIAQSEASTGCQFVNTWMHAGYLQIENEKMSKSLGNFFTIRDLLKEHIPEVLRYFLITKHYRSALQYSRDTIQQSYQALERFYIALRDLPSADALVNSEFENKFIAAMDDDFNTPIAFAVLFELAHEIQRLRDKDNQAAAQHAALLKKLGAVFGILQEDPEQFLKTGKVDIDEAAIQELIAMRNEARATKNWAEADKVRDKLLEMSIVLEDGPEGTMWKVLR